MIRFIEGQTARLKVPVASSIDTTGFTVSIVIGADVKSISSIKDGGTYFVDLSASDIDVIPQNPTYGMVEVLDANGDTYQKMMVEFQKVSIDSELARPVEYTLPIVIAANWVGTVEYSGGGGGGGGDMSDYVKKSSFASIENPSNTISGNNEAIKDILKAAKGE